MSLVSELNSVADELVECHTNLKNNLIAKGIECSEDDKLTVLVSKTFEANPVKIIDGDNCKITDITAFTRYIKSLRRYCITTP